MPGGNTGLGTSSQGFNAGGNTNSFSQTNPYGPAQTGVNTALQAAQQIASGQTGNFTNTPNQQQYFGEAFKNLGQIPNFGPAAAQTGMNFLQTGGDPTGILRREAGNLNPMAGSNIDPTQTPGMQNVLNTIRNDISNQINGQFAGAGRSLSGLNSQTLARGISQGEAVPLLNQYNQNWANKLGANQQLGNVQQGAVSNLGQGLQYGAMAPQLALQRPQAELALSQQQRAMPYQLLGQFENLINPIAGLGGTVTGTQQSNQQGTGTANNSILSQLGQAAGLINPFGGLLGTLFG